MESNRMGLSALSPLVGAADKFIREKNIPPDQVPAYLFSVGSPELAGLTAKFQRLKNAAQMMPPQGGPPPAPPTVADDINTQMAQYTGIAALPNPTMDKAQFAGGGIVAFAGGGGPLDPNYRPSVLEQYMMQQRSGDDGTEDRVRDMQPAARRVAKKPSRRNPTDTVAEATPPVKSADDYTAELEAKQAAAGIGEASKAREAQLAEQLEKDKSGAKTDRWLGLAQAGFKMAQAASRPGATFLGSLGEGGADLTASISQINKELRQTERAIDAEKHQMALGREQIKAGNITEGQRRFDAAQTRLDNLKQYREQIDVEYAKIASAERIASMRAAADSGKNTSDYLQYLDQELLAARQAGDAGKVASILSEIEKYTSVRSPGPVQARISGENRANLAIGKDTSLSTLMMMRDTARKNGDTELAQQMQRTIDEKMGTYRGDFSGASGAPNGFTVVGVRPGP